MDTGLIYLVFSVVSSSILILLFKVFAQKKVNTFQAIVVNYFVCVMTGFVMTGDSPFTSAFWQENWFWFGIALGLCFIIGFNIVAKTVQIFGVTIGSVAQKMSLLLSVSFAILYFKESVNFIKIVGLISAFIAIILTNIPAKSFNEMTGTINGLSPKDNLSKYFYLIVLTFGISGLLEIIIQYVEKGVESQGNDASFLIFAFGVAFILGFSYWMYNMMQGKMKLEQKSIIGGIALGVPNFFSLYFLMLALGQPNWEASIVFPVSNVGIIGLSSFVAFIVFKERLSPINIFGAILAMLSILLIGFSDQIIKML